MAQAVPAIVKIPTKSPQRARGKPGRAKAGRAATRGGGEVIELEYGITVYPARDEHGRWRAVWHEDGQRQQCEELGYFQPGRCTASRLVGRRSAACGDRQCSRWIMNSNYLLIVVNSSGGDTLQVTTT